jgi:hypothetical protein
MANGPTFLPADAASSGAGASADPESRGPEWHGTESRGTESRSLDAIDEVVRLDTAINSLTALRTKAIEAARHESAATRSAGSSPLLEERSFRAEIAAALRVTERTAENLIGNARVLTEALPATLNALSTGSISYRHAVVMVDELAGLPPGSQAALEAVMVPRATQLTAPKLKAAVRVARERLHPETIEERQIAARETRGVSLEDGRDGMSTLFIELASPHAHAIFNRLTSAAHGLKTSEDGRTLDQRRADVLTTVLLAEGDGLPFGVIPNQEDSENFVAWFRGIRAEVVVSVPVLTLLGASSMPGTLDGVVPIDPETARRLTAGARSFTRILTHPETGVTLSVGRRRYKVPKDLGRYLRIRDVSCRFPGCRQPAARCDLDHTYDWQYRGATEHANLAHLCRGHHTLKGNTDWNVVQSSDGSGTLHWTSPTGRSYTTTAGEQFAG